MKLKIVFPGGDYVVTECSIQDIDISLNKARKKNMSLMITAKNFNVLVNPDQILYIQEINEEKNV